MRSAGLKRVSLILPLIAGIAAAQANIPFIHPIKEITFSIPGGPIIHPVRCDDKGRVLYRRYSPGNDQLLIELDPSAKKVTTFDLSTLPKDVFKEPDKVRIADFGISTLGVFVAVVDELDGGRVIEYDDRGEYRGVIELAPHFQPQKIAVFPSGEMILNGTEPREPDSRVSALRSVSSLYDRNGKHIRDLDAGDSGALPAIGGNNKPEDLKATSLTLLQTTQTAAFLLRPAKPLVVFELGPDGEVHGKHILKSEGDDRFPVDFQVAPAGNFILIQLVDNPEQGGREYRYALYDLESGDIVETSQPDKDLVGALACYYFGRREFTFLSSRAGKGTLITASSR